MPPKPQNKGGQSTGGKPRGGGDGGRQTHSATSSGRSDKQGRAPKATTAQKPAVVPAPAPAKAPTPKPVTQVRDYDPNEVARNSGQAAVAATELAVKLELESLDAYLHTIGKVRLAVAKDGACMFRSMAQAIFESQSMHLVVREACVRYLEAKEDDYKYFIDLKCDMDDEVAVHSEYMTYTLLLRAPNAWGGQMELQSLSHVYEKDLMIYQAVPIRHPVESPTQDAMEGLESGVENASSSTSSQSSVSVKRENIPKKTHNVTLTPINNGYTEEVCLAYSHGNHYDVILDLQTLDRLVYFQKLVYHAIDTLFQKPSEREQYWLQDLSFERDPVTTLTPKERLEAYDNRQWKIWQTVLQKEKREDEQMARSLIAAEAPAPVDLSGHWEIAGTSRKKKGKNTADALAQQQQARMEEISVARSKAQAQSDLDEKLAKSMEEGMELQRSDENIAKQRQMEDDERIAMALSDEQLALELSRELNSATVTVPGTSKTAKGARPQASTTTTPAKRTSAASSPSHAASAASSTPSQQNATTPEEEGFLPASKKARNQQAKAKATEAVPAPANTKTTPKKTAAEESSPKKAATGLPSAPGTWANLASKPSEPQVTVPTSPTTPTSITTAKSTGSAKPTTAAPVTTPKETIKSEPAPAVCSPPSTSSTESVASKTSESKTTDPKTTESSTTASTSSSRGRNRRDRGNKAPSNLSNGPASSAAPAAAQEASKPSNTVDDEAMPPGIEAHTTPPIAETDATSTLNSASSSAPSDSALDLPASSPSEDHLFQQSSIAPSSILPESAFSEPSSSSVSSLNSSFASLSHAAKAAPYHPQHFAQHSQHPHQYAQHPQHAQFAQLAAQYQQQMSPEQFSAWYQYQQQQAWLRQQQYLQMQQQQQQAYQLAPQHQAFAQHPPSSPPQTDLDKPLATFSRYGH